MATYTENYNLEKPAQSDLYNIDVFNENADKIDEALGSKAANQSLAPIESTSTATRNYSVGQQFVYNGLLYEATSAIASGGTITPGSNCARTTVAEELSALNDSLTYYDLSAWEQLTTGIQYASEGHHAFVYFNIAVSLTTSFTTVATLPTGKRPSLNEYFRVTGSNGTGDVTVFVSISGAIQAKVDSGTGSAINGVICIV